MNFDSLAKPYRILEHLLFGNRLELERTKALRFLPERGKILLIGDGDGRFLSEAVKEAPDVYIDVCEMSAEMIAVSKHRVQSQSLMIDRVTWLRADFMAEFERQSEYDIVITQFVMDCYPSGRQVEFARKIKSTLKPTGAWVCADFILLGRKGNCSYRALHGLMYAFFRLCAGIEASKLDSICDAAYSAGFERKQCTRGLDPRLETSVFTPIDKC